jgi:hypothetical protein
VNGSPEKTGRGRPQREPRGLVPPRPPAENLWQSDSSSPVSFSAGRLGFSPDPNRRILPARSPESRLLPRYKTGLVRCKIASFNANLHSATKPTGGRASGERSEPVCPRPVGPGRGPSDRTEGGPTGTTDLSGGVVRFAVGADCCGALGCHETEDLLVVEQGGDSRVLCPDHARRWSG